MQALLRYPKSERSAKAREWAKRSNAVQTQARIERGVDADTLRKRAMFDAKGEIVRQGCTYRSTSETHWIVRRSVKGMVNQFDVVANGKVRMTAGRQALPFRFRPAMPTKSR